MEKFTLNHAKQLYLKFCVIWGPRFSKDSNDEVFQNVWYETWTESLCEYDLETIKKALDSFKRNSDWPPTISEFTFFCESLNGLPTVREAFQSAIRREFNHPITLSAYQKIGNWRFSNENEDTLMKAFKEAYNESVVEYRSNKERFNLEFEQHQRRIEQQ